MCAGVAYLMFYRLIVRIGFHKAITSTFMISLFSIVWGALFLGETITSLKAVGCILHPFDAAMTSGGLYLALRWLRIRLIVCLTALKAFQFCN